jgi:hypothetical protein
MIDLLLAWGFALALVAWLTLEALCLSRALRRWLDRLAGGSTPTSVQMTVEQIEEVNGYVTSHNRRGGWNG